MRVLLFFLYTDCLPASLTTRDALEVAVLADYLRVVRLIGLCDRLLAHAHHKFRPHYPFGKTGKVFYVGS